MPNKKGKGKAKVESSCSQAPDYESQLSPQKDMGGTLFSCDAQFPVRGECTNPCGGFSVTLSSFENSLHVDNLSDNKYILVEEEYDLNLTEWINNNQENIWCTVCDGYATSLSNLIIVDREWNFSRPTQKCQELIRGLLETVNKYHLKNAHGNLRATSSYLLCFDGVTLVNPKPHVASREQDMRDLAEVIFQKILVGRQIPSLLMDLQTKLNFFNPRDKLIIQDHSSLWSWERKFDFFENLWFRVHQNISSRSDPIIDVKNAIKRTSVRTARRANVDWHTRVPRNTPLYTFLGNPPRFMNIPYDLFKYIRNLFMHVGEHSNQKAYIPPNEVLYFDCRFLEILVTECFPFFQLDLLEKITRIDARK